MAECGVLAKQQVVRYSDNTTLATIMDLDDWSVAIPLSTSTIEKWVRA